MPKVASKLILLNFKRTWAKYSRSGTKFVKNGSQTIDGNVEMRLSDNLIDYYNITPYTGAAAPPPAPKLFEVKPVQVTRYLTIDASKKVVYDRRGYERVSTKRKGRKKRNSVRIELGDKKTLLGNPRYVAIPFPEWFTIAMIMQALGTMLANAAADRKPAKFMTATGTSYRIPYNVTAGAPPAGWADGAWIAQSYVTGVNLADPNDPFSDAPEQVSSPSGDMDG